MSSWSVLSVCNNVTGQPLLEYLQGNITVLATFSIARFLIFPVKIIDNAKGETLILMNELKQWVILRNYTEQNSSRLIDSWTVFQLYSSFEQYFSYIHDKNKFIFVDEWVSDCCIMPIGQFFRYMYQYIKVRTSYTSYRLDDKYLYNIYSDFPTHLYLRPRSLIIGKISV